VTRRSGVGLALALSVAAVTLGACDNDNDTVVGVGGGGTGATESVDLAIALGDGQNARTSEALSQPLVVVVSREASGSGDFTGGPDAVPVEGVEILWTITRGLATLSTPRSFSDSAGLASVTVTAGPLLGEIEVTATVADDEADFVEFGLRTTVVLVEILNDRFEVPLGGDSMEVVLGDTIEWVNRDALRHAVLSTEEPDSLFSFFSGELRNSERFRFVPRVEGVFRYTDPLSTQPEAPSGAFSVLGQDAGSLRVVTSTTGENIDRAYVVTVDGTSSSAIGPADEVTFPALSATTHAVQLLEVLPSCTVAGENPRTVLVPAQDTVTTTFEVACN
jgi:plastocyanin